MSAAHDLRKERRVSGAHKNDERTKGLAVHKRHAQDLLKVSNFDESGETFKAKVSILKFSYIPERQRKNKILQQKTMKRVELKLLY